MEISGATRLAAVIGSPVRHSLSPVMHNAAFDAAGVDWRLVALEVAPGSADRAVAAMRTLGIGGFAVTMPHKEQVAGVVDDVDPAAHALRSVNTVVLREDGTTFGASTDGAGFVDSLAEAGFAVAGTSVAVFGAGGAARAIIDALGRAGAADIAVVNRTAAAARSAADLAPTARVGTPADVASADLLVNATSVGMGDEDATPVGAELLRPDLAVADIVYHPLETALLGAARRVGAVTIDGLGMLVHQAVHQQELWTGVRPDPAVLRRAAESVLRARGDGR
jgi:shikimate dehydrogenase